MAGKPVSFPFATLLCKWSGPLYARRQQPNPQGPPAVPQTCFDSNIPQAVRVEKFGRKTLCPTQQQFGVLLVEELLEPIQRTSTRKAVQHNGQHAHPWGKLHLGVDNGVHGGDQADLLCELLNDG